MSGEFGPERRVLEALWLMLAVDEQFTRAECSPPPAQGLPEVMHPWYFAAADRRVFVDWLERMSVDREVRVSVGARAERGCEFGDWSRVLWARVESKKDAAELARFRPAPTLLLREGSTHRMVALWSLWRPLPHEWIVRANRRIAHRLGAPKKWADPQFSFPVPGSCLRVDRQRPVPVHVERFEPVVFRPREVVGALREAPNPRAWREREAAAA